MSRNTELDFMRRFVGPLLGLALSLGVGACAGEDDSEVLEPAEIGLAEAALSNQYVTTYSQFGFPTGSHSSREINLTINVDPGAGAARFFAHNFSFAQHVGYLGLQTDARLRDGTTGKVAIMSIWNATGARAGDSGSWTTPFDGEGIGYSVRIAYPWQAGRSYRLRVLERTTNSWGGYVTDLSTGRVTYLGSIQAASGTGRLRGASTTFTEYYGPDFAQCSDLRRSQVTWSRPTANNGAVASTTVSNSIGNGACASSRSSTGSGPTVHTLGL
jgi:hypothetical protein